MKDQHGYQKIAVAVMALVVYLCLIRIFGPGFETAQAADNHESLSVLSEKRDEPPELTKCSYEISVEDGLMYFKIERSGNYPLIFSSNKNTIIAGERTDKGFWIKFGSMGREASVAFFIPKEHFHKLAEMFDIAHVRRAGGVI